MIARPVMQSACRFTFSDFGYSVATLVALVASATLFVSPSAADCPASVVVCLDDNAFGNAGTTASTAPTYHAACEGVVLNDAQADFDVPNGSFDVFVSEGGNIDLRLRDAFTVVGPATGSPIALHMRVRVHGYLNWAGGCCPDQQDRLELLPLEPQAGDPAPVWSFGKSAPVPYNAFNFADSLDITLQRTAGAPIGIELHASSFLGGPSSTNLFGTFTFPDLPQGWTVNSCKGYRKEQPVPATVASWGHVKAAYR